MTPNTSFAHGPKMRQTAEKKERGSFLELVLAIFLVANIGGLNVLVPKLRGN
jgi:hypothetical protein